MGIYPHAVEQMERARHSKGVIASSARRAQTLPTETIDQIRFSKELAIDRKRRNLFLRACKEIDNRAEVRSHPVSNIINFYNCPRLGHGSSLSSHDQQQYRENLQDRRMSEVAPLPPLLDAGSVDEREELQPPLRTL